MAVPALDTDVESRALEVLGDALKLALTPPRQRIAAVATAYALGGFISGVGFCSWLLGGIFK